MFYSQLEKVNKGKELCCSALFITRTFHNSAAESRYLITVAETRVGLGLMEGEAVNYFG